MENSIQGLNGREWLKESLIFIILCSKLGISLMRQYLKIELIDLKLMSMTMK